MLAVNFSFLAVPGVVTTGAAAGPIEIIIYCSVVSTVASIVFSFGLLNVYSNPRLLVASNAVRLSHTLDFRCSRWLMTMTAEFHVEGQSNEIGNGMSCNYAQSPDRFARMVVRHRNSPIPFTLYSHVLGSRSSPWHSRYRFSVQRNLPLSRLSASNAPSSWCLWSWARVSCSC